MLTVKKGFNLKVSTKGYLGDLKDAPQKILKDLKSKGYKGIEEVKLEVAPEAIPMKAKNKNKK